MISLLFGDTSPASTADVGGAYIIALISAVVSIATMWNNRQRDRDKQMLENQRERDKREFDSRLVAQKLKIEECEDDRDELRTAHNLLVKQLVDKLGMPIDKAEVVAKTIEQRKEEKRDASASDGTLPTVGPDRDTPPR